MIVNDVRLLPNFYVDPRGPATPHCASTIFLKLSRRHNDNNEMRITKVDTFEQSNLRMHLRIDHKNSQAKADFLSRMKSAFFPTENANGIMFQREGRLIGGKFQAFIDRGNRNFAGCRAIVEWSSKDKIDKAM